MPGLSLFHRARQGPSHVPRAASFHFASCGGRGGQFLGRATNAMTAIHNSVTQALYAIANEAGCYAQLEQTSRECTEANGSMRPGDICVAMGDNSHYVDVTIAHSDLASNARLARNSPAHPQVGADAYAKEADKYCQGGLSDTLSPGHVGRYRGGKPAPPTDRPALLR